MRPQRTDTQTQSLDEVHEANAHLQRERSASNAFQSGTLSVFTAIFPTFPMNGGRREQQHSHTMPSTNKRAIYYHEVNKRINCH